MTYGADIRFFETLEEEGEKTPLSEKPELSADEDWYLAAFSELTNYRGYSPGGPACIPLTEKVAYIKLFEPPFPAQFTIRLIQALDRLYLEDWYNQQAESFKDG